MAMTLEELMALGQGTRGEDNTYTDLSSVDPSQILLARMLTDPNNTLRLEQLNTLGQQYLGRPIQTDADLNQVMAAVNQSIQGGAPGTNDPTGIFSKPDPGPWYTDPGVLIPALALGGTAAGAAGLFGGTAGTAVGGGSASLIGAGLEAPVGTALASGAQESAIADLVASGMSQEAATAAVMSGGETIGIGGAGTGAMAGAGAAGAGAAGARSIFGIPGNVISGVAQGVLGYAGANKVSNALENSQNQFFGVGAPYRNLLEQSYKPGFNLWDQPGYSDALQHTADASARAANVTYGNPYDASAQANIQSNIMAGTVLPALANYRGGLMQAGGLGLNTSGQASLLGAETAGGGLDAIGYGIGTIFNPKPDLTDILRQINKQPNLSLNIGGNLFGGR